MPDLKDTLAIEKREGPPTILQLIERQKPAIERALPASIGAERFTRLVLTEIKRNPALLDCTPESVLGALMLSAQLGLEPGPLGHAYLVPFKHECQFIIGYTGLIDLAYRSGLVKSITAEIVFEHDGFGYQKGTTPKIDHRPELDPETRGEPVAVYALAHLTTGGKPFVVLAPSEVEERRKRSPAARRGVGPWTSDPLAMWRKTAVRALRPWLPVSASFGRALVVDEAAAVWDGTDVQADAESVEDVQAPEGTEA